MANDNDTALVTGALVLGGGAAGYAAGRWLVARWLDKRKAATATAATDSTGTRPHSLPAALSPAAVQAHPPPPPARQHQMRPAASPVSSPSQMDDDTSPVSSPSQVDPDLGAITAPTVSVQDPYPATMPTIATATGTPIDPYPDSPASSASGKRLSQRFDPIFERYRSSLPIEYLRALAMRESSMNPAERSGPAWGLMQVVEVVRLDYNKAHGTTYTREQLLDPSVNVAMACWLLQLIVTSYARNHAAVPNLRADWSNPRFVELLTFGWNAGFSEKGGVGLVARYLEKQGIGITIDTIHQHAAAAGASRHLRRADKVKWCKGVAALYERERKPLAPPHRGARGWAAMRRAARP